MEHKILLFEPKGRGRFLRSPLYAASIIAKTVALSAKYLIHSLRQPVDVATTDEYIGIFWRINFQETYTRLFVTGREYLRPGETYIFMSNHESWMDIPAMFGAVPTSLRMVSKIGLTKIPIFGQAMLNAGFIAIDRKNQRRAIKQLEEAKQRIREGISIWMAPEGTRTRDGQIGAFKKGGFYLARDLSTAIVPVFIEGAQRVIPPDSVIANAHQSITVHFCEPVDASSFADMTTNELVEKVRNAILSKQQECRELALETLE